MMVDRRLHHYELSGSKGPNNKHDIVTVEDGASVGPEDCCIRG